MLFEPKIGKLLDGIEDTIYDQLKIEINQRFSFNYSYLDTFFYYGKHFNSHSTVFLIQTVLIKSQNGPNMKFRPYKIIQK